MSAKILAEEVLILMTYALDLFSRPTFRNWDASYEEWLSRNGFLKRVQYLEAQKFLEREGKYYRWVYRLTKEGRRIASGGRDPEERWGRAWDGRWRQFIFDLPIGQQRSRLALLRWLRRNHFGYLQDSVWISPDPVDRVVDSLRGFRDDAESFTILECRCAPGFKDESLVRGAWSFDEFNKAYTAYLKFAATARKQLRRRPMHPRDVFGLVRRERVEWAKAFDSDPLLPRRLWPRGYRGEQAWESRVALLASLKPHVPDVPTR